MPIRSCGYVDTELKSVNEMQEAEPRFERCKCGQHDFHSEEAKAAGEGNPQFKGLMRCYHSPCGYMEMYDRDDFDVLLEPDACDDCDGFDPAGLRFPMQVDDILYENPEITKPLGHEIGAWVAVRPCKPEFGGKTYLGVLVGEMPIRTGIQYDNERKEIHVYNGFSNPLIVMPGMSAVTYGCESWWQEIESPDDLREISDEAIESQPYVAALRRLLQDS